MMLRRHVDLPVGRPGHAGNEVLVDLALIGSIKFGVTRTPHQWNSVGVPYDMVMVLELRNGPRR